MYTHGQTAFEMANSNSNVRPMLRIVFMQYFQSISEILNDKKSDRYILGDRLEPLASFSVLSGKLTVYVLATNYTQL